MCLSPDLKVPPLRTWPARKASPLSQAASRHCVVCSLCSQEPLGSGLELRGQLLACLPPWEYADIIS